MSDMIPIFICIFGILFFLLAIGVEVALSIFLSSIISLSIFSPMPVMKILSNISFNSTNSISLLAVPLFVLIGEILTSSEISRDLFDGLSYFVRKIPGKLFHVNTAACALFAAISGSSVATLVAVGNISIPELDKRGYDKALTLGSIGSAGTLGFLIPPSMMMIIYGTLGDVSIGQLFAAGIIPGILLAICFSAYIIIRVIQKPSLSGDINEDFQSFTFKDSFQMLKKVLPTLLLILFILGSIYAGWATPTEAASVGVVLSILLSFLSGNFSFKILKQALMRTVLTSCYIAWIVFAASFLSVVVAYLGITRMICNYIASLGLSPFALIVALTIVYVILGCLLDGISVIVMTVPITLPLVTLVGFDPLWFGIYLVIMVQLAQITPPVGFNLYVLQGLTGKNVVEISRYTFPFFIIMILFTFFITLYPEIVLYLPKLMIK